jgi:hypothetical protein
MSFVDIFNEDRNHQPTYFLDDDFEWHQTPFSGLLGNDMFSMFDLDGFDGVFGGQATSSQTAG